MILSIFLGILLIISIVVIFNLLNQIEQLEGAVQKYSNDYEAVYRYILALLVKVKSDLKKIDNKGSFASDDEVGFAFKAITHSIEVLLSKLNEIEEYDKEAKEESK